jgi:hypothetical protein
MLIMLSTLNDEVALVGESIVFADLNRSTPGTYSLIGDRESGLYAVGERKCGGMGLIRRLGSSSSAGEGDGGVGVRGGAGIGRLGAIGVLIGSGVSWDNAPEVKLVLGGGMGESGLRVIVKLLIPAAIGASRGANKQGTAAVSATGLKAYSEDSSSLEKLWDCQQQNAILN